MDMEQEIMKMDIIKMSNEYNFYVDFDGHQDDPSVEAILEKLRNHSTFLKILGSYPIAKLD